jgi:hypothetical protein
MQKLSGISEAARELAMLRFAENDLAIGFNLVGQVSN